MTTGRHDDPGRLLTGMDGFAAPLTEPNPAPAGEVLLSVLDELPGFVFLQARDHSLRWANRLAREEFGDYRGRTCFEVKRGRTEPCVVCPALRVLESGRPEHWDWTDRWGRSFRMRGLLLTSTGGEPLVLAHGLEVTARNRLQSALQEAEDRFRLVLDHSGLGVVVVQDARIRMANDLACRLAGYRPREMTSGLIAKLIHPDDRDLVLQRHVDRIAGREISEVFQCRMIRKDKSVWWAAVRGTRFYWEGEPATLNFVTDITAAKQIEEQVRVALQEKEVVVREMHHHLRNNVRLLSEVLSLESAGADALPPGRIVQKTQSRLEALGLIHEVLYRSRLTTRVDLMALARGLASEMSRPSEAGAAEVELEVQGRPVYIGFDRAVVCGLVLTELIRLALDRTPGGPGRVRISVGRSNDGRVQMGLVTDGPGPGGDLTDDRDLGLNLVRGLVARQLDGRLEVGPGPGITATFQP
jgi:PAS domain S-box-containing protein